MPGGYVYVTRGLLALANNEAEVSGVLAHEIGHIAARHSAERYSKGVLLSIPAVLLGVVTGSQEVANLAGSAGAAYLQSYSRDQEYQADLLGVRYLSRTNYDPYGMASFLAPAARPTTSSIPKLAGNPEMADQSSIMASHPRTADRIQRAIQEAGGTQVEQSRSSSAISISGRSTACAMAISRRRASSAAAASRTRRCASSSRCRRASTCAIPRRLSSPSAPMAGRSCSIARPSGSTAAC